MDHLDFVVLFFSISAWFVGFGIALTARNTRAHEVAKQYRYFTLPIALFVLLEMVFYYLEAGALGPVPLWFILINSYISVTLLILCSRRVVLLAAVMTERPFAAQTTRRINVVWLIGYFVAAALLVVDAAYQTGSFVIGLPVLVYLVGGFTAAAVIMLRRSFRLRSKHQVRLLAGILAGTVVIFLEDLVVSLVDDVIFYPYAFLAINLFFIHYFAGILRRSRADGDRASDVSGIVARYDVSAREAEVLELIVRGKNRVEIGAALFISENTVKTHIGNLYRKLGVTSRDQLVELITGESDTERND